ncbi:MAG TPA: D-glycero-beta-D-manno-heptose-7-phosphate kinase [Bacteroidota bacterium]|nr:D-glycero-beta-D-manno-heptose-7-phosphate kinase [Bacteroidota bacterium]
MKQFSSARINELFAHFKNKRIAVIGDVMIDRYLWGSVTRISPEAPVPVVEIDNETSRLGGAANVANNIKTLGGTPILVGVVGNNLHGHEFRELLEQMDCPSYGIITDPTRPTTIKTRVIAQDQHVVRVDSETKRDIDSEVQQKIMDVLTEHIDAIDAIIIEDYNKGVVVKDLIRNVIALANGKKKIVTIDPKFNNFFEYKNVTLFKPNKKEAEEAIGDKFRTEEDVIEAGKLLLEKLHAENILLTRSEKGMSLFERCGDITHFPTVARKIADVSGAGDTVIATLTMLLASGATVKEAAVIANFAGGIVCGEVGIVPIEAAVLKTKMLTDGKM